jgi:hypothetical protein
VIERAWCEKLSFHHQSTKNLFDDLHHDIMKRLIFEFTLKFDLTLYKKYKKVLCKQTLNNRVAPPWVGSRSHDGWDQIPR